MILISQNFLEKEQRPYSAGTMGSESETESKPEVPASTRDDEEN